MPRKVGAKTKLRLLIPSRFLQPQRNTVMAAMAGAQQQEKRERKISKCLHYAHDLRRLAVALLLEFYASLGHDVKTKPYLISDNTATLRIGTNPHSRGPLEPA